MPSLGSSVAIFQDDHILLTLRVDFEVWCLPGGGVDLGESFAQAAIREAREETGLDVQLTCLVGNYTRPNWSNGLYHVHLFAAEVTDGTIIPQPEEVLEIRYFPVDDLPEAMLLGHRHRILDAAAGLAGIVKTELVDWPFPATSWAEIFRLHNESGLAPAAFYRQHFPPLTSEQIVVEVSGTKV